MRFHFYHTETGVLHGSAYATSIADPARALESASMNAPPEHRPIEGRFDHLSQRIDVDTGEAVDYQPLAPSADHEWDDGSKRWKLKAEVAARQDRKRAALNRIAHLEASVQPRALREVALNQSDAVRRLQAIDDEIAELRKHLEG